MTSRTRLFLAALSGLLAFASFPGVGAWPLAFVSWAPLLLALEGAAPRAAALLGFVAGLFATLPALRFLYPALRAESGFGAAACALFVLLIAAYHALRGLVVGLVSRADRSASGPPALLFVAGLAAAEIAIPSLFPWYFGASVHAVPLLVQPAELLGPVAVSVALALSSVAVAETASALLSERRTRPAVIVPALAVPIIAAFWGSLRISTIERRAAQAPAINAGVVQPNVARFAEIESVQRHRAATEELVDRGAELVVWAEGAVPWTVPAPLAEEAFAMMHLPEIPLLTGATLEGPPPESIDPSARGRLTNSALLFDEGRLIGRYDKHRLLPFSEAMPFAETFPSWKRLSPRTGHFSPGSARAPLSFRGHLIATFICYEDLFPGHVRDLMKDGEAELLVNLTNDGWFLGTDEPEMHLALAKLRAVEQRRYFVRATLTGVSAIIDPAGREVGTIAEGREGTLLSEVRWMKGRTLYNRVGDLPWWVFVVGSVGYALLRRRQARPAA